jgi:hypothetical protein
MTRRMLTLLVALSAALALAAGPAFAHLNTAAGKVIGPPLDGPNPTVGHDGIQCAADTGHTPLVAPPGAFECLSD